MLTIYVTLSPKLRLNEQLRLSWSITENTLETGYQMSDGEVDNATEVEIKGAGIITQPNNMDRAVSEVASLKCI